MREESAIVTGKKVLCRPVRKYSLGPRDYAGHL